MTINWELSPPFGRRTSLTHALEILHERSNGPLIVEIGTSEAYNPNGLGNAMLAFAWYAGEVDPGTLIMSVDSRTVENCRDILKRFCPQFAAIPKFHLGDAFDWVGTISEPIDFLYMDAGFELASEPQYGSFARRFADRIPSFYIELFNRFDPACFQPGCLMLFDDTDPTGDLGNGQYYGKGMHLIPQLLENGWRQISLRGERVFPMVLLEKL